VISISADPTKLSEPLLAAVVVILCDQCGRIAVGVLISAGSAVPHSKDVVGCHGHVVKGIVTVSTKILLPL
jgi:hypothetical protein